MTELYANALSRVITVPEKMLCSVFLGPCSCKLALPAEGSDQEVAGTQMVTAGEPRAAQRGGVAFKSNELAADREGHLSTRKSLTNWGTVCLDSDHWDLYIRAFRTTI